MKTKAMLLNDLEFKHVKDIVRQKIKHVNLPIASDIYVYPNYPCGWNAVFGILDPIMKRACVVVLHCKWGKLEYSYHPLCGFLPSGALIVRQQGDDALWK